MEEKALVAGLTEQHLIVVSYILHFYEQYLWRSAAPSDKRTRQITEVQLLIVKFQMLSTAKIGMLTASEVAYIDTAIFLFTTQAKEKVAPSESRDAVIEGCEELRKYIFDALTPPHY